MSIGKMFVSAVIADGSVSNLIQYGPIQHLFKGNEPEVYVFVRDFVKKHAALPDPSTVEAHTGEKLVKHKEPPSYYLELLERRYAELEIKKAAKASTDLLLAENGKDVEGALDVLVTAAMDLVSKRQAKQVMDFREAYDLVKQAYVDKHQGGDDYGLMFGWPTLDTASGGLRKGDLVSIVGRPAIGKALAHGTPVVMADGRRKCVEELEIGDALASVDGRPSHVFGVYAQGTRALFRVTFGDGRTLDVDGDHLWQVGCKYWDTPRIMTTTDIMRWRAKATRYADTLWVPLASGEFGDAAPLLDPYLLGVLIGDGCLTKEVSFTSIDPAVVVRAEAGLPPFYCLTKVAGDRAPSYRVVSSSDSDTRPSNVVKARLNALGLWGCKSEDKFLPEHVFFWSRKDRLALLQGLMDTDGTVAATGNVSFSSSSATLAHGVVALVRSLGGKAILQKPKKTTHLDHHRVTVILSDPAEAFSLPRKKDRCTPYTRHDPGHLRIVGVEAIGEGEATCIAVTHPSRLFLAGSYVVTHNTWQMLFAAHHGWAKAGVYKDPTFDQSRMFVSMEMATLPIAQRLAAMQTHVPMTQLLQAGLSTSNWKKLKDGLVEVKGFGAPFYVVDGNLTATVEEIWMMVRQLQPAALFIDGGYLVRHPKERDRYKRVAENADLMKSELAALCPTTVSWQFARSAAEKQKKKKKDDAANKPGLEDIGYTDAIGQVSSLVLGVLEDESVETLKQRRIEILKGRHGESGSFLTNWDFMKMDFTERVLTEVDELQYV